MKKKYWIMNLYYKDKCVRDNEWYLLEIYNSIRP